MTAKKKADTSNLESTHSGMKKWMVPIEDVLTFKTQPRRYMDPEFVETIAGSVKRWRQVQPITLRVCSSDPDYKWELVNGETRYWGARSAGETHIWAVLDEDIEDDRDHFITAVISNYHSRKPSDLEECETVLRLHTEFGVPKEEIADHMGYTSIEPIDRRIKVMSLPDRVRKRMDPSIPEKDRLTLTAAYEIAKMPNTIQGLADKQVAIARAATDGRMRHNGVKALIRQTVAEAGGTTQKRTRKPKRDMSAIIAFLERVIEDTNEFLDLEPSDFDVMFGGRETVKEVVSATVLQAIGKLNELGRKIGKSVKPRV